MEAWHRLEGCKKQEGTALKRDFQGGVNHGVMTCLCCDTWTATKGSQKPQVQQGQPEATSVTRALATVKSDSSSFEIH